MPYRVEFTPKAERQLGRLPPQAQDRLLPHIRSLADEPRPSGARKLTAPTDLYRIRVGDYRVVYEIRDQVLLVLVVLVGHRREVYRDQP